MSAGRFSGWRERRGEPLAPSRFVDLSGLSNVLQTEQLIGISVAMSGYRRTRVSDLRRVDALIGEREVASIAELEVTGVRSQGVRLFVVWGQDRLRLAFADPDVEWRKDVWDMRVFGKPQAYSVDYTAISQPWLRELAKQCPASGRRWCTPDRPGVRSSRSPSCRGRCGFAWLGEPWRLQCSAPG